MHLPNQRRDAFMRIASANSGRAKGALVATVLALAAAATAQTTPRNSAPPNPREPERIYRTTCGYCHGHNVGPVLRGRALPPEAIEMIVRNGNTGMPAFKPTEITNQELAALARWISASKADPKEHGQ